VGPDITVNQTFRASSWADRTPNVIVFMEIGGILEMESKMVYVIDAQSMGPPQSVKDMVSEKVRGGKNSYDLYREIKEDVESLWPKSRDLAQQIIDQVEQAPYAVTSPLGLDDVPSDVRDVLLLALLDKVGLFTIHDDDKKILWEVKSRESFQGDARKLTFSEKIGCCPLHSDSAFSYDPEKYLCLYVVKEADDGGGHSVVVSVSKVIEELRDEQDGERCLRLLLDTIFPFRTPPAFSKRNKTLTAPILSGASTIRFRQDCIEDGFEDIPELDTEDRRWAVSYFSDFIENRVSKHTVPATRDQLLVVDNRRSLHARTDFRDAERALIRARLHAPTSSVSAGSRLC